MRVKNTSRFRDISADRYDLAGARSWMSDICGPHRLDASRPERIQFHHLASVLPTTETTLGYVEYGTDVRIGIGDESLLNCYSLSLPLCGEQALSKSGQMLVSDPDKGVIVSPHEVQSLEIAGNCRKLQVVIPNSAVQRTLEQLLQRRPDTPLSFEPVMDAVSGATASWWRMARYMLDELEWSRDLYGQPFFARDMEAVLIKGLLLAQSHNYSAELHQRMQVRLPHYLERAREFIQANAREEVCLEDIERAAGVTRFKLFEGFRKYLGKSPMAYLKQYRLDAVHRELLEDGSLRNISVIAMDWGFNHLGRFSSDYRKRFNETPSATAARASARRAVY
ncbi:AraC family transcriptional regulator [Ectopseudomonas mendocina]|uniref:AraC family transcriptional regulator n=1 Tax=Ectopseudomonas mendocina TaxID=300 RepID=A0ABZ2RJ10_ECTME